ncbi:MAG: zinc-ribbon domain-containing protein [Clostridia bacterium]|nr:zinc-ribbon domain-containing protein [Clostridia bacterium]
MFCKNCGRQLDENENVCPVCGTVNGGETAAAASTLEYGYNAVNEANEQLKSGMGGQALTWGILSLAFSASGCLSLLGFIFSFIAKSKALAYERTFGVLEGKARVGRILGKVGFGVGLGMTIYMGFAVLLGFAIGLAEAGVM